MNYKNYSYLFLLLSFITLSSLSISHTNWGFYGHRLINKMAIYSLPTEMFGFFKTNGTYISEHAIDPDKRRYATPYEAVRHYIDIDHWGTYPYDNVPRKWTDVLMKYSSFHCIFENSDTLHFHFVFDEDADKIQLFQEDNSSNAVSFSYDEIKQSFKKNVLPLYYEEEKRIPGELVDLLFEGQTFGADFEGVLWSENFSEMGILPYHLEKMYYDLSAAMEQKNYNKILRISSEIGHYIADAHVPLHTTENYNGQLTNQVGIHAFWESRIPELLAEEEWDFLVGKAQYIENPNSYFWNIVLESNALVGEVLQIEEDLRKRFDQDELYCYEERLERTVRVECESFAKAYAAALDGQVEDRFRASILSVASVWFSAWVDAGQPDLTWDEPVEVVAEEEEKIFGKIFGRSHKNE